MKKKIGNLETFKLNSNKKVVEHNYDTVFPGLGVGGFKIRPLSLDQESEDKLNQLRAKYKLSRSALVRILLKEAK